MPAPLDAEATAPEALRGNAAFVLSLRARGVFDTNVLRAMETVSRSFFAPRRFADLARADIALPLACGQTMTSPTVVATMLAALDLRPGQRVLEVGTGSGYVSALLARLGTQVRSVERVAILADAARSRLASAGFGREIDVILGDGLEDDDADPFDRILLGGAVERITPGLFARLAEGGRLVGALSAATGGPRLLVARHGPDGARSDETGPVLRLSPLVDRPRT